MSDPSPAMSEYQNGTDTFDVYDTPSQMPWGAPDVGAPDGRGFSAPEADFATGIGRISGGSVIARGGCGEDAD